MPETNEDARNDRDCPGCGLPREDWPDDSSGGFLKDGAVYCCRGCVEGPGCTCKEYRLHSGERAPTQDEIRSDPASARFIHSLDHQTDTIGPEDYGTDITTKPPGTSYSND